MRSEVRIRARTGRGGGGTVLDVVSGHGALVPRRTGACRVHLVSTAAGPLGDDELWVRVHVGPGARLELRSVSAAQALPSRDGGPSTQTLEVTVAEGGSLDLALQPLVVVEGAQVRARSRLDVAAGARLVLTESVVLGRSPDSPGRWHGAVEADLDGQPWVRQSLSIGPGSGTWDRLLAPRALVSRLRSPAAAETGGDARHGCAVRAQLAAGGTLVTAAGPDLGTALHDADVLASERSLTASPRQPSGEP